MAIKKILFIVLTLAAIGGGIFAINYPTSPTFKQSIKVMQYKPSAKVNEDGYQIDKYENADSTAWIGDSEVLTLTTKAVSKATVIPTNENYYCSIYNLNNKSKKDFKDVNIANFYGVSPNKKYVLYMEPVYVSKETPEEVKKAEQRGKLYHGLKVLTLSTGKVTTLIPDHSNGEFKWISNDKVWASFFTGWQIIGVDGKVYASGDYPVTGFDGAFTVGADIKDLGSAVEGKIYYSIGKTKPLNLILQSMDIRTKEIKDIFSNKNSLHASKQANTIVMDNFTDHGEISPGIYNRTFGEIILDSNGKVLKNIDLPNYTSDFLLSPDGSKAAYVDSDGYTTTGKASNSTNTNTSLKVIDTKTGSIKEIVKASSLADKNWKTEYYTFKTIDKNGKTVDGSSRPISPAISNIYWDSTGASLSFTYGYQDQNDNQINSYIVSFDN